MADRHRKPMRRGMLLEVYLRDQGICWICQGHVSPEDASMDHVVPFSLGGEDTFTNLRLAHQRCNSARGAGRRQILAAGHAEQRLLNWMRDHDLSQRETAGRLKMAEEYLSRVVNGKQPVTESFIGRFFRAFGVENTQAVFGHMVGLRRGAVAVKEK